MAPPSDYQKPKNKELRELAWNLPHALRVKSKDGKILWRNKAAELLQGDQGWSEFAITWQNKAALLEMPSIAAQGGAAERIAGLEEELSRLKKQQRQTARKKRQAEAQLEKLGKHNTEETRKDGKLQARLDKAEKEKQKLSEQIKELKKEKKANSPKQSQKELAATQKKLLKAETQLEKKTSELLEAKGREKELQKEQREQSRKLEKAQKNLQRIENELEKQKEAAEEKKLQEKLAKKIEEIERLEKSFDDEQKRYEEEKTELRDRLSSQEREFESLKDQVEGQDDSLKLEEELNLKQKELLELRQLLSEKDDTIEGLRREAESSTSDANELEELKEELADAKADVQLAERREKRLSEKLDELEEKQEAKEKLVSTLEDKLEESRVREKELKKNIKLHADVRKDSGDLRERFKELEERYQELEKSESSWKKKALAGGAVAATAGVSGDSDELSLSVKNQIDFLKKRLSTTEKDLDQTRAQLKEEKAQNRAAKETERLAFQDILTGLPNNHMVDRYLSYSYQNAQSSGRRVALFLIDLDGFRVLNDTYGRDWGDSVLKAVGERLNGMRGGSHLVARHSQDRFMLLAADIEKGQGKTFASEASKALIEAIAYPFEVNGESIKLTASIGAALGPSSQGEPGELYPQAEMALDDAKSQGAAKFVLYDEQLKKAQQKETVYSKQMAFAIEKDEFAAVFQPIFHLGKGIVLGLELLTRWQHRDQRVLTPSEFLEPAIKSGLIFKITEKIWPQTFREFAKWRKMRPGLTLSINLCDKELLSPTLLKNTLTWVQQAGVDPSWVVFEVRDRSRLRLSSSWWRILQEYSRAGFGLCLDDFGADESLFGTLAFGGFTQAKLKVDDRAPKLVEAPQATKGVLYCAKGLQSKFDAKGLAKAGFHLAQGFAVSRPLDAADVDMLFN